LEATEAHTKSVRAETRLLSRASEKIKGRWARSRDWSGGWKGLDREVRGAGYGLVGEEVEGEDFEGVTAGGEGGEREVALEGDLFAGLVELFRGFVLVPDLLLIFDDAVGDGDICFVGLGVELEVIEL
jgi:hypothetical protein